MKPMLSSDPGSCPGHSCRRLAAFSASWPERRTEQGAPARLLGGSGRGDRISLKHLANDDLQVLVGHVLTLSGVNAQYFVDDGKIAIAFIYLIF